MKLTQKLSTNQFVLFISAIFIFGLIFIGGSYYLINTHLLDKGNGFSNGPITSAPKTLRIDLDQPDEDALQFSPDIIISGKTGSNLDILIMSPEKDFVIKSDSSGKFSTVIGLKSGPNKITAVVFDSSGDSRSAERNIYYSEEKL